MTSILSADPAAPAPAATSAGPPATIGPFLGRTRIAYFSMEIAARPEMHTYSGGLGVLAGDTARSCADLGIPAVFVTLVSRRGYLRQEIASSGEQMEHPDPWLPEAYATPLRAKVAVLLEGREVWVRPWLHLLRSPIGPTVPVLLLDTDLDENAEPDRRLTDELYGRDQVYRLKQEARAAEAAQEAAGPEWVWRATIVVEPYLYWCPEHRPAVAVAKTVLADVHPSVTIECVQCGRRIRKGEG